MNQLLNILKILLILGFLACDAPRENPFDPNATNYADTSDLAITSIQVFHLPPSLIGISDITVFAQEINKFALTNAQGIATIEHILRDSLTLSFSNSQYFENSGIFKDLGKENNLQFRLNAKPVISNLNLSSVYVNNEDIDNFTSIVLKADITDADGAQDIQKVAIHLEQYGFVQELEKGNGAESAFATSFYVKQISNQLNPEQVPELDFKLVVKNINSDSVSLSPMRIVRVIIEEPELLTPSGTISQTDSICFSWQPIQLNYRFTFNIVLYYSEGQEFIYFRNIPSTQFEYFIKGLAYGHYQAYLQIEDLFGNICQASFKSFNYQQ